MGGWSEVLMAGRTQTTRLATAECHGQIAEIMIEDGGLSCQGHRSWGVNEGSISMDRDCTHM